MGHIVGEGRGQRAMFPTCLDDVIAADHPCRVIDAFVEGLDMDALGFVRSTPAATGRPGYDPRDLLKLYLYGYLQQVRSSRRLELECQRNLEVMWLLNRLVPDHKVISEFRRLHREAVAGAGATLIGWARAQALLQGGWVAIDGSKFRTVSGRSGVVGLQQYLSELDEADQANQAPHPEPEARLMKTAQEGVKPAYNLQAAVEVDSGLIVAHEVITQATDNRSLWPMAEQAQQAVQAGELHVLADAGYSNGEQARQCEEAGVVTHVPANRSVNNQGRGQYFDRSRFRYDPTADQFICPAGQVLERKQQLRLERSVKYAAQASACAGCALKSQCTSAKRRFVQRHWDDEVLQRMHARATPLAMVLRKQTVERVFAELKERHFGRRFLLRGVAGAATEIALAVLAFNLKRLRSLLGGVELIGRLRTV